MATDQLLLLLNWMSPAFPIGSFAYSHGLEQAIADGRVRDETALEDWLNDLVTHGSAWNDAVIFAHCWTEKAGELNELALALAGSEERYAETTQLGRNFSIAAGMWTGQSHHDGPMAYPVAAGLACAHLRIDPHRALMAFLQNFCAALVSVAVRLVPLGQTAGLRVLRNLADVITTTAMRASSATLGELGTCCIAADIAAMQHETLEPRIFRT